MSWELNARGVPGGRKHDDNATLGIPNREIRECYIADGTFRNGTLHEVNGAIVGLQKKTPVNKAPRRKGFQDVFREYKNRPRERTEP